MICFHGTTKENAKKILEEGFRKKTWFARRLEDALEFGGTWVFMIRFDRDPFHDDEQWQFYTIRKISPQRIIRLTEYRPIVRKGYQHTATRKEKAIHRPLS